MADNLSQYGTVSDNDLAQYGVLSSPADADREAWKNIGSGAWEGVKGFIPGMASISLGHPVTSAMRLADTGTQMWNTLLHGSREDIDKLLGSLLSTTLLGHAVNLVPAEKAGPYVSKAAETVKSTATNPKLLKAAGAGTGAAVGHATGIPGGGLVGGFLGREAGEALSDLLHKPAPAPPTGGRGPSLEGREPIWSNIPADVAPAVPEAPAPSVPAQLPSGRTPGKYQLEVPPVSAPPRVPPWQTAGIAGQEYSTTPSVQLATAPAELPSGRTPGGYRPEMPPAPRPPRVPPWQTAGIAGQEYSTTPSVQLDTSNLALPSGRVPGSFATQEPGAASASAMPYGIKAADWNKLPAAMQKAIRQAVEKPAVTAPYTPAPVSIEPSPIRVTPAPTAAAQEFSTASPVDTSAIKTAAPFADLQQQIDAQIAARKATEAAPPAVTPESPPQTLSPADWVKAQLKPGPRALPEEDFGAIPEAEERYDIGSGAPLRQGSESVSTTNAAKLAVVLKNAGLTTNADVEALAPDAMRFYAEKAGIGKPSKLVLQKVGPRLEALLENPEGVALPRSIIGEPAAAAEVQPEVLNQIKTQENWDKLPPQVQNALLKNPQAAKAAMELSQSIQESTEPSVAPEQAAAAAPAVTPEVPPKASEVRYGPESTVSGRKQFTAYGLDDKGEGVERLTLKQQGGTWDIEREYYDVPPGEANKYGRKSTEIIGRGYKKGDAQAVAEAYLKGEKSPFADIEAGLPMKDYKSGNARLPDPGESRLGFNGPIEFNGETWHTNGHILVAAEPPKYWAGEGLDKEAKGPDISKVIPQSQGQKITPVGFYRPQISGSSGGNHIVFSDGTVIDSKYFDYVNKTVKPDKWTTAGTGGAPAVQAYKDGKLVGLIMPMRDPNVPAALLQRP